VGALVDLRLAVRHREHAEALAAAESGLAEAVATVTREPLRATGADSVTGSEADAAWTARWLPAGPGLRFRATGFAGSAAREIEVWAAQAGTEWRVVGWREIR
jgi:hypothetical protein